MKRVPVTLSIYSDLQCPACAYYHRFVEQLRTELGSNLEVVYPHFPLKRIHPNAELASRAILAAGCQGKEREMQNLLFERKEWAKQTKAAAEEIFLRYAAELHLNSVQFQQDLHSQEVIARINDDIQSGINFGVHVTPTFLINDKRITLPRRYDEFKGLIEKYLRR